MSSTFVYLQYLSKMPKKSKGKEKKPTKPSSGLETDPNDLPIKKMGLHEDGADGSEDDFQFDEDENDVNGEGETSVKGRECYICNVYHYQQYKTF